MKFSVIIPAYNASDYICKCLDSVTRQDFPQEEYEIIVIDDCSSDNTADIVNQYISDSQVLPPPYNIRLIRHLQNERQGGARNTGLRIAKGEWIFFLDSDDYWIRDDVFGIFNKLTERTDSNIIESESYYIDVDEPIVSESKCYDLTPDDYYLSPHHPCIWTSCYRKSYIKNTDFRQNVFYEDTDWKIKVYANAHKILMTDYKFYLYFQNPESSTKIPSEKLFEDAIIANLLCQKEFAQSSLNAETKEFRLSCSKRIYINLLLSVRNYPPKNGGRLLKKIVDSKIFENINHILSLKEMILVYSSKLFPYLTAFALFSSTRLYRMIR